MENWRFIKENNDYMVSDHGRIMRSEERRVGKECRL